MSAFDLFFRRKKIGSIVNETNVETERIGSISIPDKLTESNAFTLANTVVEIYFPIDFIADRISKLRFFIANRRDREDESTELNRFIKNINPLYSFSDLVYQYVFSYMADGNAMTYLTTPSIYKNANVNSISRLDVLQPDLVELNEYTNISTLTAQSLSDIIRQARYTYQTGFGEWLNIDGLHIDTIDATKRDYSSVLARSPLFKCLRSINNLLAVYSARYNVYVNNGAAGFLAKKAQKDSNPMEAMINDPKGRQDILNDINERHGLTGYNKNLWGISGIPIEFIKTLATISELEPFKETLEDSIKIASIFQIPPVLVPREDNPTFNNQLESERGVWENCLMSMTETVCENLTKIFTLDKVGYKINADYSSVSALTTNESTNQDLITKKLSNLEKIKTLYPEKTTEINLEIENILSSYGQN